MEKQKNEFGNTALEAYSNIIQNKMDYLNAWNNAIVNYTKRQSTIDKGCPKHTFLDLCHAGFLVGIDSEKLIPIGENGRYAIEAIGILKANNGNPQNPMQLWKRLKSNIKVNKKITHSSQMHIVLALWNAGVITTKSDTSQSSPPKIPIVRNKPTAPTQNGQSITFKVRLGVTYYEGGFFNVSVNYEHLFATDGQPITIHFGNNIWTDSINRTANRNGTPRIFGRNLLRDWFQANFKLNDMITVEVINQNSIRIY